MIPVSISVALFALACIAWRRALAAARRAEAAADRAETSERGVRVLGNHELFRGAR